MMELAPQNQPEQFTVVTPVAPIAVARHGSRAKCLQRLLRLGLNVPTAEAVVLAIRLGVHL